MSSASSPPPEPSGYELTGGGAPAAQAGARLSAGAQPYSELLDSARLAYARRAWREAREIFVLLDAQSPLGDPDLLCLAFASALQGQDEAFLELLQRLYRERCARREALAAARAAFWLGFRLMSLSRRGEGSAWLGRSQRLVDEAAVPCVEQAYLLLPRVHQLCAGGHYSEAALAAAEAAELGCRFADADVCALAQAFGARALVLIEDVARALPLLDEAFLLAAEGSLSPLVAGLVYCTAIAQCRRAHAHDRAQEWTLVLSNFCEEQPELSNFRGTCQVHRAQLLTWQGAWADALQELEQARVLNRSVADRAEADYQAGEVHRFRGSFGLALANYQVAAEAGREPQPGLSLLYLATGTPERAHAGLARALAETHNRLDRAELLAAGVQIELALGHVESAENHCRELEATAGHSQSDALGALSAQARGAVLLAQDQPADATAALRRAFAAWQRLGAPYAAAQTQELLAQACRRLGDPDGADLALGAAQRTFERLDARPDLARLAGGPLPSPGVEPSPALGPGAAVGSTSPLSLRELQVLARVAAGETNRAVALHLHLSEKTIDRHMSNIFCKLQVSSRAAATARAMKLGLL